jgi:TRAP transporter TAXI family solute receptor
LLRPVQAFLACAVLAAAGTASAQDLQFFSIGTGGVAGTYYPIGGLIADVISNPPGGRPCDRGGSCGVPGLVAIAQTSNGSIDNITSILDGSLDSGFAQSDIAFGAFNGTGVFEGQTPAEDLRIIASLYLESVHLVVGPNSGIESIEDVRSKRISVDDAGSGTRVDALLILNAFGIGEDDIEAFSDKPSGALRLMRRDQLDGFFIVAGYPTPSVVEATEDQNASLLPLAGPEIDTLLQTHPFFSKDVIPAGTYANVGEIETIGVVAQWLTSATKDEDLIYQITRSLWHPRGRALLDNGHVKGLEVTLETALHGVGIPLHPGAERYYRELGLIEQ